MENLIELLKKIITNVLTALYQPFWFAVILTVFLLFFYLYAYKPIETGKGIRAAFRAWWQEFRTLAEYLKGNAKVKEVLQKKGDLTVIQGGKVHGNISSLMDESRMEELMTFLKSEFDYVIIDTPPAYLFSDAAILAGYADCVLYVVRHDMAEIPQIEKGMESFIQEDKLLGYLINRSQKGFASYGKYGYGKYGYGKYGYGKYGKYQRYVDVKEDDMDTEDSL